MAKVDIETAEYPLLGALLAKGEAKATGGKARGKKALAKDAYWGVNQVALVGKKKGGGGMPLS